MQNSKSAGQNKILAPRGPQIHHFAAKELHNAKLHVPKRPKWL